MCKKICLIFFGICVFLAGTAQQVDTSQFSFYQVYSKVISPSCAVPACHDGSFEPDYRTLESAYYTLVYHPIIKNNSSGKFTYRVVPHNPALSVLLERISNCCFVNVNDRMPFTVGDTLSQEKITLVKNWIDEGAKDIYGTEPQLVIAPVSILNYYNAYVRDSICVSTPENRTEDRFTGKKFKPFIVHTRFKSMKLVFNVNTDDKKRLKLISNPQVRISDRFYDFSNAKTINLKPGNKGFECELLLSDLKPGKVYYMQVELFDEKAKHVVTFPELDTPDMAKHIWSFLVTD